MIIEHIGAAAKLFNACQSKPQRATTAVLKMFHVEDYEWLTFTPFLAPTKQKVCITTIFFSKEYQS